MSRAVEEMLYKKSCMKSNSPRPEGRGEYPPRSPKIHAGATIAQAALELVKPEVVALVMELRRPQVITPVVFPKRRVGHVSRRPHVRIARLFRPLRPLAWPIVVRKVVIRIVEVAVEGFIGRFLHNHTSLEIQNWLQLYGYSLVILPIRVGAGSMAIPATSQAA